MHRVDVLEVGCCAGFFGLSTVLVKHKLEPHGSTTPSSSNTAPIASPPWTSRSLWSDQSINVGKLNHNEISKTGCQVRIKKRIVPIAWVTLEDRSAYWAPHVAWFILQLVYYCLFKTVVLECNSAFRNTFALQPPRFPLVPNLTRLSVLKWYAASGSFGVCVSAEAPAPHHQEWSPILTAASVDSLAFGYSFTA
ncbi:hypothetical protein HRG_012178 [Hirsutella rhossiliensis]